MISSTLQVRLDLVRAGGTVSAEAIDKFAAHLRNAPEEALFRMSPFKWGRANAIEDRDALELFLRATHAGVLEFSWGTVCPACGGFSSTPAGLQAVAASRCAMCEIDIDGGVTEAVEVAFTVAPGIRRIRFHAPETLDVAIDGVHTLFSANLGRAALVRNSFSRVVVAGGRLEAHSTHAERTALAAGPYVVFVPASNTAVRFRAAENAEREDLEIELFDGSAIVSAPEVKAGRLDLSIRNKSGHSVDYLLLNDPRPDPSTLTEEAKAAFEKSLDALRAQDAWLSGRRLLTSQTFQELFRAESIPSDGGLDVKSLAILFTDLQGSTQLYQRVGDFKAFETVRDHFALLRECVASSGGAVVKTIGDAVMAAFSEPREAADAAVQMHRRIAKVAPGDLSLKVGLHEGPCIAVHLNDRLDYFGSTVNIAARVQGKAAGGEIVLTESSYRAHDVERVLRAAEFVGSRESVELKGISGDVPIRRLKPALR